VQFDRPVLVFGATVWRLLDWNTNNWCLYCMSEKNAFDVKPGVRFDLGIAGVTGVRFLPVGPVWPVHTLY